MDKPSQPKLQKFPINTNFSSKKTRSFNANWYNRFDWLEYNIQSDAAFCFACKNFSSRSSADTTFTVTGFRKWTNALDKDKGFMKHQKSEVHKNCHEKWKAKVRISEGTDTSILEKLVPDQSKTTQNNREYFKLLFQYVIWFATNEIAFRGHDEAADSKNPGNWTTFIKMQLKTNKEFRSLHQAITEKRLFVDYTSKTSLNEMLSVLAVQIRKEICHQIETAGCFSALIDESKDKGKREELAFSVRYYTNKVQERFLSMTALTKFDAEAISAVTKDLISDVQQKSNGSPIISLGADGASVMSGWLAGVAELLRSRYFKWLVYIHCTAHRLNLVVGDMLKASLSSMDVMTTIKSCHILLNKPKIRQKYESFHREMYPGKQVKHIVQQIDVRWGCKYEAVNVISERFDVVLTTLIDVANNPGGSDEDSEDDEYEYTKSQAETAAGLYHKLMSGKFIVGLTTLHKYLGKLYFLNKELQTKEIDWTDVQYELTRTRDLINNIKDEDILIESKDISRKTGNPLALRDTMPIHNTRATTVMTPDDQDHQVKEFIGDLNEELKKKLNDEFNVRFDSKNIDILRAINALNAGSDTYLNLSELDVLLNTFSCLNINRSILELEIERAEVDYRLGLPINPSRLPNLTTLIAVKNTISTSTASVERAFSGMNRICTKLRSTLIPERLSDLLCISLNRDVADLLDLDEVVTAWGNMRNRRAKV